MTRAPVTVALDLTAVPFGRQEALLRQLLLGDAVPPRVGDGALRVIPVMGDPQSADRVGRELAQRGPLRLLPGREAVGLSLPGGADGPDAARAVRAARSCGLRVACRAARDGDADIVVTTSAPQLAAAAAVFTAGLQPGTTAPVGAAVLDDDAILVDVLAPVSEPGSCVTGAALGVALRVAATGEAPTQVGTWRVPASATPRGCPAVPAPGGGSIGFVEVTHPVAVTVAGDAVLALQARAAGARSLREHPAADAAAPGWSVPVVVLGTPLVVVGLPVPDDGPGRDTAAGPHPVWPLLERLLGLPMATAAVLGQLVAERRRRAGWEPV